MLDLAARLGLRGFGDVAPNPMVGCVIGRVEHGRAVILGLGHHRRFGGPHAEVDALESCRRRGFDPASATAWVTLEPCAHVGETPACVDALAQARLARVVYARSDPHPDARGGAERLRSLGVRAEPSDASPSATALAAPFASRVTTGLPWVIAKWAQTMDGRLATRAGESKWISCEKSRARVHRLRSGVDVIITGVGTVIADDPLLTARDVPRVRRRARRIILDPALRTPATARIVRTAGEVPTILVGARGCLSSSAARPLEAAGAEIWESPGASPIDLRWVLTECARRWRASSVLVEAGPRTLGRFLDADLIDQAVAFVAPRALGDEDAIPTISGCPPMSLAESSAFRLADVRRSGVDALLAWVRSLE